MEYDQQLQNNTGNAKIWELWITKQLNFLIMLL